MDAVKSFLTLSSLWRTLFPAFGYVLEVGTKNHTLFQNNEFIVGIPAYLFLSEQSWFIKPVVTGLLYDSSSKIPNHFSLLVIWHQTSAVWKLSCSLKHILECANSPDNKIVLIT